MLMIKRAARSAKNALSLYVSQRVASSTSSSRWRWTVGSSACATCGVKDRRMNALLGSISTAAVLACGLAHAAGATGNTFTTVQPLASCAYGTAVPGLTGLLSTAVGNAAGSYA